MFGDEKAPLKGSGALRLMPVLTTGGRGVQKRADRSRCAGFKTDVCQRERSFKVVVEGKTPLRVTFLVYRQKLAALVRRFS